MGNYWGPALLYTESFNEVIEKTCELLDDDCKIILLTGGVLQWVVGCLPLSLSLLAGFSIVKKNLCLKIMTLLRRLTRMLPPRERTLNSCPRRRRIGFFCRR